MIKLVEWVFLRLIGMIFGLAAVAVLVAAINQVGGEVLAIVGGAVIGWLLLVKLSYMFLFRM